MTDKERKIGASFRLIQTPPIDEVGRYCHLKKDYKNTVKPNHFFVILKHSAPIGDGYSVTTFRKLTGKQSKINMIFGHFQRFSAPKSGGGGFALFFF